MNKGKVELVTCQVRVWSFLTLVISSVGICTSLIPMCLCQAIRAKEIAKYLDWSQWL
jgi:hypothetical protein